MYKRPLWDTESRMVYGESGLFQGAKPAKLLFPAEEILRVYNPTLQTEYLPGKHFLHTPGSDVITPVPGSGICALEEGGLHPDPAAARVFPAPHANAIKGGPDGKLLLFSNEDLFARLQFNVDYRAVPGSVFPELPLSSPAVLPRTFKKLAAGETVIVNLIGDSISEGYNATEFIKAPPYAPPYLNILAQNLKKRFHSHIQVRNSAIAGTGCYHADAIEERWLEPVCDLLIIAYGMNDLRSVEPEAFKKQISRIMEKKLARHPGTEFILVTPMTRNPLWGGNADDRSRLFSAALDSLAAPGCAVADVCALWMKILERKDVYDLAGNGVNHPNDYGHRIYNAVIENIFNNINR